VPATRSVAATNNQQLTTNNWLAAENRQLATSSRYSLPADGRRLTAESPKKLTAEC